MLAEIEEVMKNNVKQHFVPQYYLRNFTNNGQLHVYDIDKKLSFTNSPNNFQVSRTTARKLV